MSAPELIALALGGSVVGVLIGSAGVGGVLLVPFLISGLGFPVRVAVAVALWSYLWSGLVAVALYGRRGSVPWRDAGWLCLAAVPGAYLGASAMAVVPGTLLTGLIAGVLILGGVQTLRPQGQGPAELRRLGRSTLVVLGALTGFASALVGAGGAFLLVPVLLLLGQPVLLAVGLGQAIQVPISAVASATNLRTGWIDLPAGSVLAVALSLGIAIGTPLAHGLPPRPLRRLVGSAMVLAGATTLVRLATLSWRLR
jgi:uncharacterized membrane protein YfcA